MNQYLETPEQIREQIWKQLVRAAEDRHHAWRTPVLATVDATGMPNARTVVLRKVHQIGVMGTIDLYTDRRSPKVSELVAQPNACLVFWSARLRWQLRVRIIVSVQTDGLPVSSLWQSVRQTRAAVDYMRAKPPGASLPHACGALAQQTPHDDSQAAYFAVLNAQVTEIDWLELGREQHRRAKIVGDTWQWLVP